MLIHDLLHQYLVDIKCVTHVFGHISSYDESIYATYSIPHITNIAVTSSCIVVSSKVNMTLKYKIYILVFL